MHRLARMPEPGDMIELSGFRLRVLSLGDLRVGRTTVERMENALLSDPFAAESESVGSKKKLGNAGGD
jgi:hypothetical protein